jgi:hypothetical protein
MSTSGFKMFEKPPPKSYDAKAHLTVHMNSVRDQEKIYGPVFTTRMIEHVLQFIIQRTGEKLTGDIKTLEQLTQYLTSRLDKYPTPHCAMMYGQYKTENELQGSAGAGRRIGDIQFMRKTDLKAKDGAEREIDIGSAVSQFWHVSIALKMCPGEVGYKKNEDGSFGLLLPNCYYKDGCKQAYNEGLLSRPGGRWICNMGFSVCIFLKASTGYDWESDCLEYDKPHCIVRHHML